ncbi:MAG: RNA 2',3'-cyclic phosphodiesterase [Chloroflexi bacterium]|nr:RNA 2',3'-cyclic phosphodiesterase [Chloroflexota bacterium]
MATVRTFIAIEMTPLQETLSQIQERLRDGPGGQAGRWVRCEGIHLTLKFLGEIPEEQLPEVFQAVDRACRGCPPFDLCLAHTGCFPNARSPRVVWVGVEEKTGQLQALQRAIEDQLASLGFAREKRAFQPHLTLARIHQRATRSEAQQLGQATMACDIPAEATMRVERVSVIRSDLKPGGAVYTPLHTTRLSP